MSKFAPRSSACSAQQVLGEQDADDVLAVGVHAPESASGRSRSRSAGCAAADRRRRTQIIWLCGTMMSRTCRSDDVEHALEHRQRVGVEQALALRLRRISRSCARSFGAVKLRIRRSSRWVVPLESAIAQRAPRARPGTPQRVGVAIAEGRQHAHLAALHAPRVVVRARGRSPRGAARRARPDAPSARSGLLPCSRASRRSTAGQMTTSPSGARRHAGRRGGGKGQHVRRPVLAAVALVQALHLAVATRSARASSRPGPRAPERRVGPARHLPRCDGVCAPRAAHAVDREGCGAAHRVPAPRRPARSAAPADGARRRPRRNA